MRIRFLLTLAGMTFWGISTALAQTTNGPASVPTPTLEAAGSVAAVPSYNGQAGQTSTVGVPTPGAGGVIVPEKGAYQSYIPYGVPDEDKPKHAYGSVYIPLDSWVYPQMMRLYSMGYLDSMFLAMRPYTRGAALHMLEESQDDIVQGTNEQAQSILARLLTELESEKPGGTGPRGLVFGAQSIYNRAMYIGGTSLRDSYHIGNTIVNDYGRPYQPGYNNLLGGSIVAEKGRFSLYVRGEYQHAPSAAGYFDQLADYLSGVDTVIPTGFGRDQDTVPRGPIAAQNPFRLVEATVSFHLLNHEISGGKQDAWLGPGRGGSLAWTNNAENIYSFRINRVDPLYIPLLSKVLGPVRYDFMYGSLKGHTSPNHPYIHTEMFEFRPTVNFQFGFQRTIIFGGAGHSPVTFAKFIRGFFDIADTTNDEKYSRDDPGARYSTFNASYRLPFLRRSTTFYVDAISHDDVTPISAPRRASFRTGLYVSHIPLASKLDFRVEAVVTDPRVTPSFAGQFNYFETIQKQGYTNKGYIIGDWMGREAKGGQAWMTYHQSPTEWYEVEYLRKKNAKDFIGLGTTQNAWKFTAVKRFKQDYELNAWVQYERWKAPAYKVGLQNDTTVSVQFTYFPKLRSKD